MKLEFTKQFDQSYYELTPDDMNQVDKSLRLLVTNIRHPGLRVKKMQANEDIWEARCSIRLRMTFAMAGDRLVMRNVGEHDKVLKNP